jgi:hypothetical protein
MPKIINDLSHYSGKIFKTIIKDEYEEIFPRREDPNEIVFVNNIPGHFTIYKTGIIMKDNHVKEIINSNDKDNRQVFLKIIIDNDEQDYLSYQQEESIMYLAENLMDEYDIQELNSWVPGVKPEFFRRALEL